MKPRCSPRPARPVGCAGLLFLLRPTLALLASQAPLRPVLLALCGGLLDELFERLSPASRRAAWLREAPLVQVFAGLDEPPAEPAALTADRTAVAQASRVLERLQARLDPAVAAAPRACAYVLGVDAAPLTALQRLLLRAGRLWVGPHHATLRLPAAAIDLAVRRGGWDVDPGWQPRIGRVVRFEYLAS